MSKDIDFIISDIKIIARPQKTIQPVLRREQKKDKNTSKSHTFSIQKSFIAKQQILPEKLSESVQSLKKFMRQKREKQKKLKEMLAEGTISKDDFQNKDKKNSPEKEQQKQKIAVDKGGQLRDQEGNLVFVTAHTTDLKINQKKEHQTKVKELKKKQQIKFHQKLSRNLLDRNLVVGTTKRRLRRSMMGLQFLEQGSYQPITSSEKKKVELNQLNDVFKEEEQPIKIIKKRNKTSLQYTKQIPEIEWWDKQILNFQQYDEAKTLNEQTQIEEFIDVTKLCNEVKYQKVGEQKKQNKVNIPLYLTKVEQKKLKRKRKKEKLQEKNDKIKLGLIEPDKPKLKISNMAVVMKDEFIMDPSKVEAEAKKQTQERIDQHLRNNSDRKLSRSQKKEKVLRKLKRDSATECKRAVFRIERLDDPSHQFKVNINAEQLALGGFVLKPAEYHKQPVMIIAEGGVKAIKFYKHLLLNRINWSEKDEGNRCKLVWEGTVENPSFGKWKQHQVSDESQTLKILAEKKLQSFWQYI